MPDKLGNTIDGKAYTVTELTEGYIVGIFEPSSPQAIIRVAALSLQDVGRILKRFGLNLMEQPETH